MVRTALQEGRLDLTEIDDRISRVYEAKTHADLTDVIQDLVPKPVSRPLAPYVTPQPPALVSDKAITPALVLCGLFGIFGAHVFYTGPLGLAWVRLILPFTGIGAPVAIGWWLLDIILLTIGRYKDGKGKPVTDWI
jgi:TM2 domain-containing membrane protein YozV